MHRLIRAACLACPPLLLALQAGASVHYYAITGQSAGSENGCPAWVLETNDDDCSYNGGKPLGLGNAQWIGPVFSAGYYAPGAAPLVFTNNPQPGPVVAPAPDLPLGGKTGIPITRGFIAINDRDTAAASDDVISGTLEFGAFERNVATGAASRVIESFSRIIHRLNAVRVNSAAPNAAGGFDYVVASSSGSPLYPERLAGSTTAAGGFSDQFPSEVASVSSPDPADAPYWTAPGPQGIAMLDGTDFISGTLTTATVWGYSCNDGFAPPGPAGCLTSAVNWDGDSRAAYDNVLLKISTDSSGAITAAEAFVVNEADLSQSVTGDDSWFATTLEFSGPGTDAPEAFDDRTVILDTASGTTVNVLANDLPGKAPVTVSIVTPPASGTAEVASGSTQITYTRGSTPASEQVIGYRITDANDATADANLVVIITDPITCENDEVTGALNSDTVVDVTANDAGFDIPPVTVTITQAPAAGTAVVNPGLSITFTPPPDTGGLFQIPYELNDGSNRPAFCTASVRIPAVPRAVDDTAGVIIDTPKSIDVLANDEQISDTPLTLTVTAAPDHGTASIDTSGPTPVIRYTPNAGYTGPDAISYTITDTDGDTSNAATVAITVFGPPQTDAPACTDDTAESGRDVSTTVDVLANDTGLNAAPVSVKIVAQSPSTLGTWVVNPDNTVTFTPPAGKGGTYLAQYEAKEAINNPVFCIVSVRVDDQPVAKDDNLDGVNFGQVITVGLLNNDSGLSDTPITLTITQPPVHGTVRVCDAVSADCPGFFPGSLPFVVYTYNDAAGYPATDTFRYQLEDVDGDLSGEATVTITPKNVLTAENDPDGFQTPATAFRTASGYSIVLNVLANDAGLFNTPLTVTLESAPAGGKAVVNADNTITFTADGGFVGPSTFDYRVTDALGNTSTATVSLSVFPPPVTKSGGSALGLAELALLGAVAALRRRTRKSGR